MLIEDRDALARRFPAAFAWGAATAAFQIEGAHDADGKGPSIWDAFCRRPGAIATGETGDVACDHYHRWRDDVALMAELGLTAYRFSISWPRVLPQGTGAVNEAGLAFYDRLIDALLERGIEPFVTLYHWDLPQALQDRGGWAAPATIEAFGAYADVVARRLGDRVRHWLTLNEPRIVAFLGHASGEHAPGVRDLPTALRVAHHLLLAHAAGAAAIHASRASALVGIALDLSPCEPAGPSPADAAAAVRADGGLYRWFLDPLFGRGYPRDIVPLYAPYFDGAAQMAGFGGRLDMLGINYYDPRVVRAGTAAPLRADQVIPPGAETTAMGWEVRPSSLVSLLQRVTRDYAPRRIHVTENGAAYDDVPVGGRIDDLERLSFVSRHVAAAADAIDAGVPLEGYFVWSLLDNFEWAYGTSKRFGLVHVDYASQRRRVKASGRWYQALIDAHRASVRSAASPDTGVDAS